MKTNFRPGLNDADIFYTASELNEYLLPDHIEQDDVIIDIGSHIGGFIWGCLKRGNKNIYGYEAFKESYDLSVSNFSDEIKDGSVKVFHLAVWRSDIFNPITLYNSGFCQPDNSGTNVVVYNTTTERPVSTISLDDIISIVGGKVKLLKLDCEGSEFPILFTSKKLHQIDYICGEYHSIELCNFEKDGKSKFTELDLYFYLKSIGFNMIYFKNTLNDLIGMFYAKRNDLLDTFFKNIIIP